MLKLLPGLHRFRTEVHSGNESFFEKLAKGQSPEAIFITCSDSRVDPNLITQTDPGDLFVIRNAGNIVPAHEAAVGGEEATIEYAINHLQIKEIIVCGHSMCGAMQGLLHPELLGLMPAVAKWLSHTKKTKEIVEEHYSDLEPECMLNIAIQENVLVQLENLRALPCIARKVMKREIEVHGWVYEIETGEVYIYNAISEEFEAVVAGLDGFGLGAGLGFVKCSTPESQQS